MILLMTIIYISSKSEITISIVVHNMSLLVDHWLQPDDHLVVGNGRHEGEKMALNVPVVRLI